MLNGFVGILLLGRDKVFKFLIEYTCFKGLWPLLCRLSFPSLAVTLIGCKVKNQNAQFLCINIIFFGMCLKYLNVCLAACMWLLCNHPHKHM
jgi:hypothetical protein